jgi:hypothetical protein
MADATRSEAGCQWWYRMVVDDPFQRSVQGRLDKLLVGVVSTRLGQIRVRRYSLDNDDRYPVRLLQAISVICG